MQKVKSNIKYALCAINIIISIISMAIIANALQNYSMKVNIVFELAVGALFIGVINAFLISFTGLLGKLRESKCSELITSACTKYNDLYVCYTLVQVLCLGLIFVVRLLKIA